MVSPSFVMKVKKFFPYLEVVTHPLIFCAKYVAFCAQVVNPLEWISAAAGHWDPRSFPALFRGTSEITLSGSLKTQV